MSRSEPQSLQQANCPQKNRRLWAPFCTAHHTSHTTHHTPQTGTPHTTDHTRTHTHTHAHTHHTTHYTGQMADGTHRTTHNTQHTTDTTHGTQHMAHSTQHMQRRLTPKYLAISVSHLRWQQRQRSGQRNPTEGRMEGTSGRWDRNRNRRRGTFVLHCAFVVLPNPVCQEECDLVARQHNPLCSGPDGHGQPVGVGIVGQDQPRPLRVEARQTRRVSVRGGGI